MGDAGLRFSAALERSLNGWTRKPSDLLSGSEDATLLTNGTTGAVMILSGDSMKPGQFRALMEALVKRAKTVGPGPSPIPWNFLVVLLVFDEPCSSDMRTFVQSERRPLTPPRFVQGGWVDLSSGEAEFRVNRTAAETELLQAVQEVAAGSVGSASSSASYDDDFPPPRAPSRGPAPKSAPKPPPKSPMPPGAPKKKGRSAAPLIVGVVLVVGASAGLWYTTRDSTSPSAGQSPATVAAGTNSSPDAGRSPASGASRQPATAHESPAAKSSRPPVASATASRAPVAPPPAASPSVVATHSSAPVPPAEAAAALARKGQQLLANKDVKGAMDAFDQALKIDPKCAPALAGKGTVYSAGAEVAYRGKDPGAAKLYALAVSNLEQAVALDPKDATSASNLGACYYRLERYPDAIKATSQAIALQPENARLYAQRAMASSRMHDDAHAIDDYTRAWEISHQEMFLFNRANCELRLGKRAEAQADYEKVIAGSSPEIAQEAKENLAAMNGGSASPQAAGH